MCITHTVEWKRTKKNVCEYPINGLGNEGEGVGGENEKKEKGKVQKRNIQREMHFHSTPKPGEK